MRRSEAEDRGARRIERQVSVRPKWGQEKGRSELGLREREREETERETGTDIQTDTQTQRHKDIKKNKHKRRKYKKTGAIILLLSHKVK